jgi:hypothetical protein
VTRFFDAFGIFIFDETWSGFFRQPEFFSHWSNLGFFTSKKVIFWKKCVFGLTCENREVSDIINKS